MTESPGDDPGDEATRKGLVRRYRALTFVWYSNQDRIKYHQGQLAEIEAAQTALAEQARNLLAVGQLFSFDLEAAYRQEVQREIDQLRVGQSETVEDLPQPSMPVGVIPKTPSVKDAVLEIARLAYPAAVRAKDIRAELLTRGITTHEKTVGMTCYRWLRENRLRRDGWDWYYLPESEGAPAGASEHQRGGASSAAMH